MRTNVKVRTAVSLTLATLTIGCGGPSSPPAGFNSNPMSYVQPAESSPETLASRDQTDLNPAEGGKEIAIPTIKVADRGSNVVELAIEAKSNQEMVVEGAFEVPTPVMCGVLVIVDVIEASQVGGKDIRHVVAHADGLAMKGDVPKGLLKYAIRINAPKVKGSYAIEVKYLHIQTANEMYLGASGVAKID